MKNAPKIVESGVVDVDFGSGCIIVHPSNLYRCKLEDDVFIGPFCEIQNGVVIGSRSRIQSHSFICELVTIGEDCFVGHGVTFINDSFAKGAPARGDRSLYQATAIGNGVSIGSNATILPVRIADGCVIGAGSVVSKDCSEKGIYAGNPARLLRTIP